MLLPGGVFGRNVQRVKVVPVRFDLRPFGHRKAHVGKDRRQFLHHLRNRVDGAAWAGAGGQGDIEPFAAQAGIKGSIAKGGFPGTQGGVNLIAQHVQHGAGGAALVRVHLAKRGHQGRNLALFAKGGQAHLFQCGFVCGSGHSGEVFAFRCVQPVHHRLRSMPDGATHGGARLQVSAEQR